jgi:hypothetical protein
MDPFFEILRALGTAIGWIFTGIFSLFGALADSASSAVDRRTTARLEEDKARRDQQIMAGPNADTATLEAEATSLVQRAAFPTMEEFVDGFSERYIKSCKDGIATWSVRYPLLIAGTNLYVAENLSLPPAVRVLSGAIEAGRYRDELLAHIKKVYEPGKTL